MTDIQKEVDFNFIRYANCWEDPVILLAGLSPRPQVRILSIASAGDNSFSLLTADPALVVAVDVNVVQLYLVELKKVAIKYMEYPDLLAFLGYTSTAKRIHMFQSIKQQLSTEARHYWASHTSLLDKGIIHQGKFEKYFQIFAKRVLPFIHSHRAIEALLSPKEELAQQQHYQRHWNTWRWRLFFKIFFSKVVMGRLGRDPQFLKEVDVHVGDYIFKKAGRHLQKQQAQCNPFLRYNLTGTFGDLRPHYLQESHFNTIKSNIDRLEIQHGYAEQVATMFGNFDAMNLSNIFEYMSKPVFAQTASALLRSLHPEGRMAYWNLMVPRRVSGIFPAEAEYLSALSNELSAVDSGFFYNQFIVDQR